MTSISDLEDAVGADSAHHDRRDLAVFGKDAGVTAGTAVGAVLPRSTEEVAACMRVARKHDIPIVPRGAGTGLAGGAVPAKPGLLIVLMRLNQIHSVDEVGRTAWVGPGLINLDLSKTAGGSGIVFRTRPVIATGEHDRWQPRYKCRWSALSCRRYEGRPHPCL